MHSKVSVGPRGRAAADRGSAAVEMVILTPVLVIILLFIVYLGRASGAVEQVRHAADAGARAASIVSRSSMGNVARLVALADLHSNGVNCTSTEVTVSVANDPRVSSVSVTVRCAVNAQATTPLGATARTVSATSTEVIDRYRGS